MKHFNNKHDLNLRHLYCTVQWIIVNECTYDPALGNTGWIHLIWKQNIKQSSYSNIWNIHQMFHQKYNEIKIFKSLKPIFFLKNNISLFYNILQINQLNHILQMNIVKKKSCEW